MRRTLLPLLLLIALLLSACGNTQTLSAEIDPVDVYAVLAAKDDYKDVGMTDLLVDYVDLTRLREALESLGWPAESIIELREFTREDLLAEMDRLEAQADANDLVFFYVASHGRYLSDVVVWQDFFPAEWEEIPSLNKVLLVDSCQAAKFTNQLSGEVGLTIAAVDEDEYGWKGIEEEGLPIVGGIFTYYFAKALTDPADDGNGDGKISVQEAALAAEELQRDYMHDVVFSVPEFLEGYYGLGVEPDKDETFPDVIISKSLEGELFLSKDPQ